jgi:hypothetical protein
MAKVLMILQFFLILFGVSISTSCKPVRSNLRESSVRGGFESLKKIQDSTATLVTEITQLTQESLLSDDVIKYAKSQGKNLKNRLTPPPNCPTVLWDSTLGWNHKFLGKLIQVAENAESFQERAVALKGLIRLGSIHDLACWKQQVTALMPRAIRDSQPPAVLLAGKGERLKNYACSTIINCSIAMEIAAFMVEEAPYAKVTDNLLRKVRESISSLFFQGPTSDVLSYRIDSILARRDFYVASGIKMPHYAGRHIVTSATEPKVVAVTKKLQALSVQYEALFNRVLNQSPIIRNGVNSFLHHQFIEYDVLGEDIQYQALDEQEQAAIDSYARQFFQTAQSAYYANKGLWLYLERLKSKDPRPWLSKVRKMVDAFAAISEKEAILGSVSAQDIERTIKVYGLDRMNLGDYRGLLDDPGSADFNVEYLFMALTMFMEREMMLPYRAEFIQTCKYLISRMSQAQIAQVAPQIRMVQELINGNENLVNRYLSGVIPGASDKFSLPKEYNTAAASARKVIGRLLRDEVEFANNAKLQGFESVYRMILDFMRAMTIREGAQAKFIDKLEEPMSWQYIKEETNRILWNPASGRAEFEFNVDKSISSVIASWLMIQCLDRGFTQEGRRLGPAIDEKFFLDGTPIKFTCPRGADWQTLSYRANAYANSISLDLVRHKLKDAINHHPFLHAAQALAVSTVMPSVSFGLIKAMSTIGRAIPGTARMMSLVSTLGRFRLTRLAYESWLFGVIDFGIKRKVRHALNVEIPKELESQEVNALWNVNGIIQGAVIFGLVPMAHGPVDGFVKKLFTNKILGKDLAAAVTNSARRNQKLAFGTFKNFSRRFSLGALSMGAQYNTEAAIFTVYPMIMEKATVLYQQRVALNYQEKTDQDELLEKIYGESVVQRVVGSYITAGAFTANRLTKMSMESAGYPKGLAQELRFWGVKSRAALGTPRSKRKVNPYEILRVSRTASQKEIDMAYELRSYGLNKSIESLQSQGVKISRGEQAKFQERIRSLTMAYKLLSGQRDWRNFVADQDYFPPVKGATGDTPTELRRRVDAALFGDRSQQGQTRWSGAKVFKDGDHDRF